LSKIWVIGQSSAIARASGSSILATLNEVGSKPVVPV
jgi:hypothetical protein